MAVDDHLRIVYVTAEGNRWTAVVDRVTPAPGPGRRYDLIYDQIVRRVHGGAVVQRVALDVPEGDPVAPPAGHYCYRERVVMVPPRVSGGIIPSQEDS